MASVSLFSVSKRFGRMAAMADVSLVGLSDAQRKDRNGRFYKWRDAMLVATNDVAVPLQPDTWRGINEKWLEFNKTFK
jgi:hypothetical protein